MDSQTRILKNERIEDAEAMLRRLKLAAGDKELQVFIHVGQRKLITVESFDRLHRKLLPGRISTTGPDRTEMEVNRGIGLA